MRKSIKLLIVLIVLLFAGILLSNKTFAAGGYTIEDYNVDMIVNEDNTFNITETIKTNFTQYKHGIYRKLPLKNTIMRLDGTSSKNKARISNISVNAKNKIYNENGYKIIQIGDANRTIIGEQTYVIKYSYDLGKDPLENADEIYFNLIGNQWDTSISKVNFKITMPKEFDKSKLGFASGYYGSSNALDVDFNVDGNVITGSTLKSLSSGEGLTVRCELPEGYFVYKLRINYKAIVEMAVAIIFVIIAFVLWFKYGRDEKEVETVEFYPPDNLNSVDIGYYYKGKSSRQDAISLLIYLANKGYLEIQEIENKSKLLNKKDFRIMKLKPYDGDNNEERTFFNDLFRHREVVTKDDLEDSFYTTLDKVVTGVSRKENREKLYDKTSLAKCGVVSIFLVILGIDFIFNVYNIIKEGIYDVFDIALPLVEILCLIALVLFVVITKKRTKYGVEILGKIKGFKNFLETAEKDKLEALVEKDPQYFYNILPYTYVLGVSSKWMKKFESIAVEPPNWYNSHNAFDIIMFNHFMNSTYSSISTAMTSTPSSSGGGGFSGGGFSGGGSGGGRRRLLVILRFYYKLSNSIELN